MARYVRIVQIDNEEPSWLALASDSAKAAISDSLTSLEALVDAHPETLTAVSLIGEEGGPSGDTRWLGGWIWFQGSGFEWSQDGLAD